MALLVDVDGTTEAEEAEEPPNDDSSESSFQAKAASIRQRLRRAEMGLALNQLVIDSRRDNDTEEFRRLEQTALLISKVAQDAIAAAEAAGGATDGRRA